MKILWVSTFPPRRCGIGDYAADLAPNVARSSGISLRVLTYPDGHKRGITNEDGFQVSRGLGDRPISTTIASEIADFQPDLVHLQSSSFLHRPSVNRALIQSNELPLVTTVHDAPRSWRVFYTIPSLRKVYRRSSALFVHSAEVVRTLSEFHGVDAKKIIRIPHGVDLRQYSPDASAEPARERYNLRERRIVLFFGFLRPGKGLEWLLEAWSSIARSNPEVLLVIAGGLPTMARRYLLRMRDEASYPDTLSRLAAALGIGESVRFLGYVPGSLVSSLLSSADVIVLPYEGLRSQSGPIHKALASGRPLISSKVTGTEELLEDGKTALLVPPRNARLLAEAIQRVLSEETLAQTLGRNARRLAEDRLDWFQVARTTVEVYQKVVMGNAGVSSSTGIRGAREEHSRSGVQT